MNTHDTPHAPPAVDRAADVVLCQRAATQRDAQTALAERLLARVHTTVRCLVAGAADLDDLTQTALVEILRSAPGYEGRASLEHWADRIAVRHVLRQRKRDWWRRLARPWSERTSEPSTNTRSGAQDWGDQMMVRARLVALLQSVPEKQRVVVVLRVVYGYTIDEIAVTIDVPTNTVRDRLQTGRRKLRALAERDATLADWAREHL